MTGNSNTLPATSLMINDGQYQFRWNILRNDRFTIPNDPATPADPSSPNGPLVENYDFEYNTRYIAKEVSKKEIMLAIIRERYDIPDEISIAMKREQDILKLQAHEEYVTSARATADQILQSLQQ